MEDFTVGIEDIAQELKEQVDNHYRAIEKELKRHIGHLSPEQIRERCRRVTNVREPRVWRFYLDDKLILVSRLLVTGRV